MLGLFWLVAPLVGAVTEDAEVEPPPKSVTLDQLLTLPSALPVESGQHGGLTRGEWSGRFAEAEAGVVAARADLAESLDEVAEAALVLGTDVGVEVHPYTGAAFPYLPPVYGQGKGVLLQRHHDRSHSYLIVKRFS
ncbi:MAG: hypothetical protein IH827_05660 [Myxococcales bacterium]|nr:hypothetical protein [Myxococcales bacterium]